MRWLDEGGWEPGVTISASQMNDLGRAWWWTRLDPGWGPHTRDESQAILDGLGLIGDFWAL